MGTSLDKPAAKKAFNVDTKIKKEQHTEVYNRE
jgi:hypothetical protein